MSFDALPFKDYGDTLTEALWDQVAAAVNYGAMRPLADSTLGSSQTTITLSSIDQDFAVLLLLITGRGAAATSQVNLYVNVNQDTGNRYDAEVMNLSSSAAGAEDLAAAKWTIAGFPAATGTTNRFGAVKLWLPFYADTGFHKSVMWQNNRMRDNTATNFLTQFGAGWWRDTSAISRIDLTLSSGDFAAGTRVTLHAMGSPA